jgi:hypothetical protein
MSVTHELVGSHQVMVGHSSSFHTKIEKALLKRSSEPAPACNCQLFGKMCLDWAEALCSKEYCVCHKSAKVLIAVHDSAHNYGFSSLKSC